MHDTINWLMGLPRVTYLSGNGSNYTQVNKTSYYSATGAYKSLPKYEYSLGRWVKRYITYYTSGTQSGLLKSEQLNDINRITDYFDYKRGTPLQIQRSQPHSTSKQHAYQVIDNKGWVTIQTDFNGGCINYGYNNIGWIEKVDPCNSKWSETNISYTFTSGNDGYRHVASGMLKKTISKGNYRNITYYDGLLRPHLTREYDTARVSDTQRFNRTEYDAYNRPTYQSQLSSSSGTSYGVTTSYDGLGRVNVVNDNTTSGSLSYSYLANNTVRVNNNRGYNTTTTYLAYGSPSQSQPTTIASPQSVTTTTAYNLFGNPTSISQGGLTEYRVYDSYQQLCKIVRADIGNQAFSFNEIGLLNWSAHGSSVDSSTSSCDSSIAASQKTTYSYDNHGNVRTVSFGDGTPTKTYTYDRNDNLKKLTFNGVNQDYTYNDLNDIKTERLRVDSIDWTIEHKYDSSNNVNALEYSGGGNLTYQPNALGQSTRIGSFANSVKFHPNGLLKSFNHQNGCTNTLSLYNSGMPNVQRSLCRNINAVYNQYHWDANGNLTFWDDKQSNSYDLRLSYDQLDRMDNIRKANNTLIGDMHYDTMGNITKFDSVVGGAINYHYNSNKQLTSTSGYKSYNFDYDDRGNVIGNGTHSFTYNLANNMIEADSSYYVYDGHGKRVKTVDSTGTRYSMYLLDGRLIQEMIDGNRREYYYLNSQLVAQQDAESKTYVHPDGLGSTAAKSNASHAVIERNHYAPYGNAWGSAPDNEIGYTGHKYDTDIGLTYMQARYYDPVIGRFYSNDPVGA
ncbi:MULTISPECIES: RHS repeat domain-containing protein [unclassified Pseudoalteromonas]|uniref:RHS repeat domain-containing protein n=1 Tax=unclassified Pseudoalteromonas TaxID=194690 RepID=UPI003014D5AE